MKGSYTVEAALLMTIIIPLLTGILYLGFYLHNEAVMQNAAYELAVLGSFQHGEEEKKMMEERKKSITGQGFLGLQDVQADADMGKKKISVKLYGTFRVPGLVMRFFCQNQMRICADAELTVTDPGRTVTRIHLLRKLIEEGGNGSNVSP